MRVASCRQNGLRRLAGPTALVLALVLALAGCRSGSSKEDDDKPSASQTPSVRPVVEVGEGCPSAEDFGTADFYDDESYADHYASLDVELLDAYLETPLPAGGCAYARNEAVDSNNSDDSYRRVSVAYFNLGVEGRPSADDLRTWAQEAEAQDSGIEKTDGTFSEPDGTEWALPETFSGWTGAALSIHTNRIAFGNQTIPEFTERDNAVVQFSLHEGDVDAIEANSGEGADEQRDPTTAMADGLDAPFAATFSMEDEQGYTVDVELSGSLAPFTSEVVNSLPGEFEAVSRGSRVQAVATNTTDGRNAKVPEFTVSAFYDIDSDFCGGRGYVSKVGDAWQDPSFCRLQIKLHRESEIEADGRAVLELVGSDIVASGLDESSAALEDLNAPVGIYVSLGSRGGISTSVEAQAATGCQTSGGNGDEWFVPMDGWPDPVCS